ncbi:MAG: GNAT family N-acetyltransferase [Oligoflexales bacterium]
MTIHLNTTAVVRLVTSDPEEFWRDAKPILLKAEAENCLLIGKIMNAIGSPDDASGRRFFLYMRRDDFAAGMCNLKTQNLVLGSSSPGLIEEVLNLLKNTRARLAQVIGPQEAVQLLIQSTSLFEQPLNRLLGLSLYELNQVNTFAFPSGRFRRVTAKDMPTIAEWTMEFVREALLQTPTQNKEELEKSLDKKTHFVWHNDKPVSMASYTGETPNGARIVGVYTPPESRGKGYGAACVAELCSVILKEGKTRVYLFADSHNPQSNHIYQKIGFNVVGQFVQYRTAN